MQYQNPQAGPLAVIASDHRPRKVDVLDAATCQAARQRILDLRRHWTQRHPDLPFYTLGTASYLDAAQEGFAYYCRRKDQTNPILRARFAELLDQVAGALAEVLGEEVFYDDDFALPGFHVFEAHPAFRQPVASIHRDNQYRTLEWNKYGDAVDVSNPVSFTLPLALPRAGGGLNYWQGCRSETGFDAENPSFLPYEVGKMAFHSGRMTHQIAPAREVHPADERITLQGHGLRTARGWMLYW